MEEVAFPAVAIVSALSREHLATVRLSEDCLNVFCLKRKIQDLLSIPVECQQLLRDGQTEALPDGEPVADLACATILLIRKLPKLSAPSLLFDICNNEEEDKAALVRCLLENVAFLVSDTEGQDDFEGVWALADDPTRIVTTISEGVVKWHWVFVQDERRWVRTPQVETTQLRVQDGVVELDWPSRFARGVRQHQRVIGLLPAEGTLQWENGIVWTRRWDCINYTDSSEQTALHMAARHGHRGVCRELLSSTLFTKMNARDAWTQTALHIAASAGHAGVCQELLECERFTQVNAVLVPRSGAAGHMHRSTALHLAARAGSAETCRALLQSERFTCAEGRNVHGNCAVHGAFVLGKNLAQVCQVFWESGHAHAKDSLGRSMLHLAAQHGHAGLVASILTAVPTVARGVDSKGRTALHYAASAGSRGACRILLSTAGSSEVNLADPRGKTALHYAVAAATGAVWDEFLQCERFVSVNAKSAYGRTALHIGAECGNLGACLAMLEHERFDQADAADRMGHTALHLAASEGHRQVCLALLQHQRFTAVRARDNLGRGPLELMKGHLSEFVEVFDASLCCALHEAAGEYEGCGRPEKPECSESWVQWLRERRDSQIFAAKLEQSFAPSCTVCGCGSERDSVGDQVCYCDSCKADGCSPRS